MLQVLRDRSNHYIECDISKLLQIVAYLILVLPQFKSLDLNYLDHLQIIYLRRSIRLWRPWGWSVNASVEGK